MPIYLNPTSVVYFRIDARPGIEVVVVIGRNLPNFRSEMQYPLPFVCSDLLVVPSLMVSCGRPCVGPYRHFGSCRADAGTQVGPLDLRVRRGRRPATLAQLQPLPTLDPPSFFSRSTVHHLSSGVPVHPTNAIPISSGQDPIPPVSPSTEDRSRSDLRALLLASPRVPAAPAPVLDEPMPSTSAGGPRIFVRRLSSMMNAPLLANEQQPSSTFPMPFVVKHESNFNSDEETETE